MRVEFKTRGHFCNYCRKILFNKCPQFQHYYINQAIWYVWDTQDSGLRQKFIMDLVATDSMTKVKGFNAQLKVLRDKHVPYEYRRKKSCPKSS